MPDTYLPAAARTIYGGPLEHAGTLETCPFCGGDAEIGVEVQGGYFVQCANAACGASSALVFPLMDDVKHLLVERWNKRVAADRHAPDQVAELRALADSEGTRAVEYLRRARKAEQVLREIAEHVGQYSDHTEDSFRRGLMALMVPAHQALKAEAVGPNVRGKRQ